MKGFWFAGAALAGVLVIVAATTSKRPPRPRPGPLPSQFELLSSIVLAQTPAASAAPIGAPTAAPRFGAWGFDTTGIDPQAKPGDSFSDYANGAWERRTEIPPDRSRYGAFDALRDLSEERTRVIIEDAAKADAALDTNTGKIGALYASFMDEARLDALDATPLAAELARIRATTSKVDVAALMGRARGDFGVSLFGVSVGEDEKNPGFHALYTSQSGLGLPDRDYYLTDAFKDKKAKYRDHVARLLGMVGWPDAQRRADDIVAFETLIAEASWTR